ncbi:hypothetical protein, partial [Cronobacter sakazakii]|uniref:hypothetical protein n=1 Tax=Cronobacter sakazakii TaxID=28141 RepID=UPI001F3D9095
KIPADPVGALRLPTLREKSQPTRRVRCAYPPYMQKSRLTPVGALRLPTLRAKIPTDLVGALTHLALNPLIS